MHQSSVNTAKSNSNGVMSGLCFDKLSTGIFSAETSSSSSTTDLEQAFSNLSLSDENPRIKAYTKAYDDQVLKEEKRCQESVRLFETTVQDKASTTAVEECVVCLTELPHDLHHYVPRTDVAKQFLCCGKHICVPCITKTFEFSANPEHPFEMTACLHCRSRATGSTATMPLTRNLAVKGQPWAQARMAFYYDAGIAGLSRDMKQAIGWYTKAADQGFTRAQVELGLCYMIGRGVVESDKKALYYLEQAARKGDPKALYAVVMISVCARHVGNTKHKEMADLLLLLTVAATKGNTDAQLMLGLAYRKYWGPSTKEDIFYKFPKSLELAEYWLTKAVDEKGGREPAKAVDEGHLELVHVLIDRAQKHLKTGFIPGYCPLPRAYRHAVKAVELEVEPGKCTFAAKFLTMSDAQLKEYCAVCKSGHKKLTKCSQCKVFYYCGKKCQAKHWKAGHCNDCVKTNFNNKKKGGE